MIARGMTGSYVEVQGDGESTSRVHFSKVKCRFDRQVPVWSRGGLLPAPPKLRAGWPGWPALWYKDAVRFMSNVESCRLLGVPRAQVGAFGEIPMTLAGVIIGNRSNWSCT